MTIINPVFVDGSNNTISVEIDGVQMSVPVDSGNRHYKMIKDSLLPIAPYVEPPTPPEPTKEELIASDPTASALIEVLAELTNSVPSEVVTKVANKLRGK